MIIWGILLLGQIKHYPEGPHIATQFFHLFFFPLVPVKSVLVLPPTPGTEEKEGGFKLPLSGLSIAIAYLRALCTFSLLGILAGMLILRDGSFFGLSSGWGWAVNLVLFLALAVARVTLSVHRNVRPMDMRTHERLWALLSPEQRDWILTRYEQISIPKGGTRFAGLREGRSSPLSRPAAAPSEASAPAAQDSVDLPA